MFGLTERVSAILVGVAAAIALGLGVWAAVLHGQRDAARLLAERERVAHAATVAGYRAASAAAQAADLARARTTEAHFATVVKDRTDDLDQALGAARADAARHADRLRRLAAAAADPRRRDDPHLSAAAGRAPAAAGAGPPPGLDDAQACAAAVVKAEAWQAFWRDVKAASDADRAVH